MPNYQGVWSLSTHYQNAADWPTILTGASMGLRFGGRLSSAGNDIVDIRFININILSNESDFGDLTGGRSHFGALGNTTRTITAGGYNGSSATNIIEFINPTSFSNGTDFGDMTTAKNLTAGLANSTRGVIGGGSVNTNEIDFITIASAGNATDFGNLSLGRELMNGGASSPTRGMFFGGNT